MKKFITEFEKFIMRGSVLDLAVGIIVGGAFQKIVSSLVNDVAFPAFSPILGGVGFSEWKLGPIMIGNFIEATVDFLIISFFVFVVVRIANRLKHKNEEEKESQLSRQEQLLVEIRDALKQSKD